MYSLTVDCLSGELIEESTVISATVDGSDQVENAEVAVDSQSDQVSSFVSDVDGCSLVISSNAAQLPTISLLSQATSTADSGYTIVDVVGARLVNHQRSPEDVLSADIEFDANFTNVVQVLAPVSVAD